jgi:predicted nucleic acid-binding protein
MVVDASAVVEILEGRAFAASILHALDEADRAFAPHLLDVEVLSAIRKRASGGHIAAQRVAGMLELLADLPIERLSHGPILGRIWELRHNFTPYDAAYIALAEQTNSTLYTLDAKLLRGHRARVVLFRR